MNKTIFFVKYLKTIIKFINNLLEKNLNKLNLKNISNLLLNNKIILTFVALVVIFISYLLLPTFYKQSDIINQLKTELESKFDINFEFSKNLEYNFFPKPHFTTYEASVFDDEIEISKINKLKIYISLDNLFSFKSIQVKDLLFKDASFNLNKKNYNFFLNTLNKISYDANLIILDSNIFFRNIENQVLFVKNISKMKYYYEPKELKKILYAENEIFNIPYSIKSFFNDDRSKVVSQINLNLLKLKIENELSFNSEHKIGKSDLTFNKLKRFAEYKIEKNYFEFKIFDKTDQSSMSYKGKFNLKPFYSTLEGRADKMNFNHLFDYNGIIAKLLKTQILNNKNIDFKLNLDTDSIYGNLNFKKIRLNSKIQEGLIDVDNTKFEWKDFVDFEISDSLLFVKDGQLVLDGKLSININDYNEIYKFLLTPKKYRNKINQIDLNFTYNFDQKIFETTDIIIDNKINQNVDRILNNIILKDDNFQNKIYLKKIFNEALKVYSG